MTLSVADRAPDPSSHPGEAPISDYPVRWGVDFGCGWITPTRKIPTRVLSVPPCQVDVQTLRADGRDLEVVGVLDGQLLDERADALPVGNGGRDRRVWLF